MANAYRIIAIDHVIFAAVLKTHQRNENINIKNADQINITSINAKYDIK